jgi:uncharacterized protein (DUF608 family)
MDCIPCTWYGSLPFTLFFPSQARTTLRAFKAYQREDGEVPFALGMMGELPDLATPEYTHQVSLNATCYVDLVDRLWLRTGDRGVIREFWDSLKRANTFTMGLRRGPGAVIGMPERGGMEWFEWGEWAGLATHMGGLRLAHLRHLERMAREIGDEEYAKQCRAWLDDGSRAMEEVLWAGSYYLNFYEPETGKKSDAVMGYQLDGEWSSRFHGDPGVFRSDRVATTLQTIRDRNVALTPKMGAANFASPSGGPLPSTDKVAMYGQYSMFTPEVLMLAMTYVQAGERDFGLEMARKFWQNIVIEQRHPWDGPNVIRGDTGQRTYGTDYSQNMFLWTLPAVVMGEDLATFCGPGHLVDRILRAGAGSAATT